MRQRSAEFLETVEEELGRRLRERIRSEPRLTSILLAVERGEQEPYSSALRVLEEDLSVGDQLGSTCES